MKVILPKEGTLFKKDYSLKLEYNREIAYREKVFKFVLLKLKSWEGIKRTYEKSEGQIYFMKEQEFINYLYNEGYIDKKTL